MRQTFAANTDELLHTTRDWPSEKDPCPKIEDIRPDLAASLPISLRTVFHFMSTKARVPSEEAVPKDTPATAEGK